LNVIPNGLISVSELGFFNNHNQNSESLNRSLQFLLNYDGVVSKNSYLRVYQGHHGDANTETSDVILPSTIFVEKISTYLNIFGMAQKTEMAVPNFGNSRDD
jgi:NADH dehydrogenase/NADH:ubiquinone oxidoreductase subunit G